MTEKNDIRKTITGKGIDVYRPSPVTFAFHHYKSYENETIRRMTIIFHSKVQT